MKLNWMKIIDKAGVVWFSGSCVAFAVALGAGLWATMALAVMGVVYTYKVIKYWKIIDNLPSTQQLLQQVVDSHTLNINHLEQIKHLNAIIKNLTEPETAEDDTFRRLMREDDFEKVKQEVRSAQSVANQTALAKTLIRLGWTTDEFDSACNEEHATFLAQMQTKLVQKKWWQFWK